MSRFGNVKSINALIKENIPRNTSYSHKYIWGIFMEFCCERKYELNEHRSLEELVLILKDWAVNMRKKDGTEFKEATVKTMWNVSSKLLQEKYYKDYNIMIDPFQSIIFKPARDARDAIRKKLQANPCKRKSSSVSLNLSEVNRIIMLWDENTPEGLMRKFYHIAAVELAWRGGEAVACLVDFFQVEKNNDGSPTNRIEYNPVFSKTCQGGSKSCTSSKWLVSNSKRESCPVRLFHKLISKRGENITSPRLFLKPNRHWKNQNDKWYDNVPVGRNTINGWTKSAAEAIGLNIKDKKITNHSNRSTAVSQLAKSGVEEQQLLKITGHSNQNSIKPYLNLDQEHHNKIINIMRGNRSSNVENSNESNVKLNFSNCTFTNCTFNK